MKKVGIPPRPLQIHKKMAKIHKYWSRKPWNLMEYQILRNSSKGDMVLDPFCGSGSVGLEAILMGRNFIGYDLNPFAIKLSTSTLTNNFEIELFETELENLITKVKSEIMDLYRHGSNYVMYSIPGKGNTKDYNLVLSDYCFEKTGQEFDPKLEIEYGLNPNFPIDIPDRNFPSKFYKDRFSYKGVERVSDLFATRSLKALAVLRREIDLLPEELRLDFTLILTNTLLHVSKLKSEKVRPLGVNNYWIPDDFIEENVIWRFIDRAKQFKIAKEEICLRFRAAKNYEIGIFELRNISSIPMEDLQDGSIDYILTDPPYGDVIQYSELSFVWNVWLEEILDSTSELIVNPVQEKDDRYFLDKLSIFILDCFRVLKNGHNLTLCFQNKDPEVWFEVARIASDAGFVLKSVETFDFLGSTFNKNWSKNSPKVDLYLTLTKVEPSKRFRNTDRPEITMETLLKMVEKYGNSTDIGQVHDWYSKVIAVGIAEILNGSQIVSFSKKGLTEFLHSKSEDLADNAKYMQTELF
jgi:DNA modification methylase